MIDASLLLRLRQERKRLGFSQEAVAARVGVERETWSRYENGHIQPGTEVWKELALLGADVNYILSGLGVQQEAAPYGIVLKAPDEIKHIENYRSITEEKKKILREVGAAFAQPNEISQAKG